MKTQIASYVGSAGHLYWLVTEGGIHPQYAKDILDTHDCKKSEEDGCETCEKYETERNKH